MLEKHRPLSLLVWITLVGLGIYHSVFRFKHVSSLHVQRTVPREARPGWLGTVVSEGRSYLLPF